MKTIYLFLFLSSLFFIQACASKRLTNKAIELENAGLFKEAADYYYQALSKKRDNIDAKIGLKRNGQKVLDDLINKFYTSYTTKDYQNAVYHYIDGQNYDHKIQSVGVILNFPNHYNQFFTESKAVFLDELYKKGKITFKEKNYQQSEKIFGEIVSIDDLFKDSQQLLEISIIEPMYLNGKQLLTNNKYKSAYYQFNDICNRNINYKDVQLLQEKSLKEAQLSIAILPFYSSSNHSLYSQTILSQVTDDLLKVQNPFIQLIDRSSVLNVLDDQKFVTANILDVKKSVNIGKLIGAKTVFFARINDLVIENPLPKIERKTAYLKTEEKVFDEKTKLYRTSLKYEETKYSELYIKHTIRINFDFQLISIENGEILTSESVNYTTKDNVHFAKYSLGDYKLLSPNPNNPNLERDKQALYQLFKNRSDIKSIETLIIEACNHTSNQVVKDILKYENSRP